LPGVLAPQVGVVPADESDGLNTTVDPSAGSAGADSERQLAQLSERCAGALRYGSDLGRRKVDRA
jgi:hypothetical protein